MRIYDSCIPNTFVLEFYIEYFGEFIVPFAYFFSFASLVIQILS